MYPINGAAVKDQQKRYGLNYRRIQLGAGNKCGVNADPANKDKIISWTKSYYDAVHPFSAGGAYVNFLMGDEGEERVKKTYGGNYDRLVTIKKKYDPDNFFRVNQNVGPDCIYLPAGLTKSASPSWRERIEVRGEIALSSRTNPLLCEGIGKKTRGVHQ